MLEMVDIKEEKGIVKEKVIKQCRCSSTDRAADLYSAGWGFKFLLRLKKKVIKLTQNE